MSSVAGDPRAFPGVALRAQGPPPAVRFSVTVLAAVVAAAAGLALFQHATIFMDGQRGASLYNSGEPGLACPHLLAAANGTRLHARPCLDLGDMAVWAIDDGVFQHFYRIDDTWALAKLGLLSYAEALGRQPGSAKAWAGLAELFKKVRVLRIKEGIVNLDILGEEESVSYDEEDRLVIEAYRRAVRFEPNNYFYHAYLGDFYDERGFRQEALASYARAVEIMPDLSWHYYLPATDVPDDLYAAARLGLEKALENNKAFAKDRILQNMGDLAERGGDLKSAERFYKSAADTALDPSPYLRLLGTLYFTEKRYDEAESTLRQALERDTLLPEKKAMAHTLIGRCAMIRKDDRKAVEHLQQARWLSPSTSYIAVDLARAYENLGMIDKAEAEYKAAIRLEPGKASAYTALIDMYRRTRQINKAIPLAERLVEMYPDNQIFRDQLRALNRDLGRPDTG